MRIFLTIGFITSLITCQYKTSVPSYSNFEEQDIEFSIIKEGTNSGHKTSGAKIIHNKEELSTAWIVLYKNYMENPLLPEIDFEKNQLILVIMGEQTSGGHTIKIETIKESKKEIIVNIKESNPGKTCMTTSVMTYPYQLVMLPKTNKKIIYTRTEKVYECEKE